nr:ATP-binding cassette domain-containing protein [Planctomycetales bacterium]NIM08521.1 ATP-binding cassette domain-containing protein [Planctomycetales bacterium]NIN07994.1 ATP-binding cassette domain-containing protein [Planctomycetales bacterium]NIN77123.1 ATP-binding cassette domain-containing protein [Planctomycetales bacterium]NIO34307.1 ATP-binding cassette domain-containing protein [Planctomycetales bacterium]
QIGELQVHALVDFTLDIYAAELLVLAGPSGSGKTTALNIIGGLDQCTSGSILFRGQDMTRASGRELTRYRRESVGFVFQFYNLVPDLTAVENVMVATELCEQPLDERHALQLVDLDQRLHHFPSQLSGGEQQRVAIARALAKNPDLLLCDEPTGALDFVTGKRALRLLSDVARKMGKTVIIITHNTAIAEMADRVVHLRSGEIVSVDINPTPKEAEEIVW